MPHGTAESPQAGDAVARGSGVSTSRPRASKDTDLAQRPEDAPVVTEPPKTGRPRKFTDPEELDVAIHQYFLACDDEKRPYTMAGLARAVGCSTSTLRNYGDHPFREGFIVAPEFVQALKSAKARVEQWTEERLFGKGHPAGPIFSLKNNFGWKDVQQVEVQSRTLVLGVQLGDEQRRIIAEQLLSAAQSAIAPAPLTLSPSDSHDLHSVSVERKPSSVA